MQQTAVDNLRFEFARLKKLAVLLVAILSATGISEAQSFHKTKMFDPKGKLVSVDLSFDLKSQQLTAKPRRVAGAEVVPFNAIDKLSYERAAHHRVRQGAELMAWSGGGYPAAPALVFLGASLSAGPAVMLTREKTHWFYVDYKQDGVARHLIFKLDKSEYEQILETAKEQTGKNVEILGRKSRTTSSFKNSEPGQ